MGGLEGLGETNNLGNLRDLGAKINSGVVSLQDPNAAPYTGDDPIIRQRLGMPPVDDTTPTPTVVAASPPESVTARNCNCNSESTSIDR